MFPILNKLKSFSFFESFKHASVYFLGTLLIQGLGIISLPVLTYFLSEEEYGITNVYMSYILISSVLLSLNLEWAILRYFLEPNADKKGFITSIFIAIHIIFPILALLVYLYSYSISHFINLPETLIGWLLLYTYTNIIWFIYAHLRIVEKNSKELTLVQTIVQYAKFGVVVIFIILFKKYGSEGYLGKIVGELVINAIATIGFLIVIWPFLNFRLFKWQHLKYAFYYSIPLVPYALGGQILTSFDQWYINSALGNEEAGFYSFAYKIGLLMNGLLIAFHNASMVQYTNLMDEKKYEEVSNQVYSIHKLTLLAGLFLILFSVDMGTLLAAKASFRNSLTIVPIIVGGYILYGIAMLYSRVFNYKKINIYLTLVLLLSAVVNIFLNMEFIPLYGYKAAAYTTLFSYLIMALASWIICSFWLKFPKLPLAKIILSTLPILGISLLFYYFKLESVGMSPPIIALKLFIFSLFGFILFYKTIHRILFRK